MAPLNRVLREGELSVLLFLLLPLTNLLCLVYFDFDHRDQGLVVGTRHQLQLLQFVHSRHWQWLLGVIQLLDHVPNHGDVLLRLRLSGKGQETFQPSPLVFDSIPSLSNVHHLLVFPLILLAYSVHFVEIDSKRVLRMLPTAHGAIAILNCAFRILSGVGRSSRVLLVV